MSNGLVERFHRHLKAAIMAQPDPTDWTDCLVLVLLGIRTALKKDLGCTPAELVYDSILRLVCLHGGKYRADSATLPTMSTIYDKDSVQSLHELQTNSDQFTTDNFCHRDAVRKPLQPPYDEPYMVISRTDKYYMIGVKGRQEVVSLDRLKPSL